MSPPKRAEMSIFIASRRTSFVLTASPLIGPALYLGNMMATSGQTREQAGQSVLQLLSCWTWILPSGEAPYTPNKQKLRHCMRLVQRVVNHWKPGLPAFAIALRSTHGAECFHQGENVLDQTGDVAKADRQIQNVIPGLGQPSAEAPENQRLLGLGGTVQGETSGPRITGPRILVREGPRRRPFRNSHSRAVPHPGPS